MAKIEIGKEFFNENTGTLYSVISGPNSGGLYWCEMSDEYSEEMQDYIHFSQSWVSAFDLEKLS